MRGILVARARCGVAPAGATAEAKARDEAMTLARDTGEVLQWFADRGFGFIAPDAGGRRVFFHITSLERGAGIEVGQRVEYGTITEEKGPRAVGVRVV